jgi:hypothetical protein
MKKQISVAVAIACGVLAFGVLSSAAQDDQTSTAEMVEKSPPISVIEDKTPDSLHLWHLHERTDATATVGDEISFIGQVEAAGNEVRLEEPPWLTVAISKEPPAGANHAPAYQLSSFPCDQLPKSIDATGFVRFTAQLLVNRPDLSNDAKSRKNIPLLRIEPVKIEPIPCRRTVADLKKSAAADIRAIEPRLRELCGRYNLRYDFDESKLARSWYQGQMAFTSIASTHPLFSTEPLPYATISALYEPVTGQLSGFVFTRRIWQDPPD